MKKTYKKTLSLIITINFIFCTFALNVSAQDLKITYQEFYNKGEVFLVEDGLRLEVIDEKIVAVVGHENKDIITTLNIPSNVRYKNVDFQVTSVAESAFDNAKNLENVYISLGVENIENKAFSNCGRMKQIYFPHTIEKIGESAVANCGKLRDVWIASDDENIKISNNAFLGVGVENTQKTIFYGNTPNIYKDLSMFKNNWSEQRFTYQFSDKLANTFYYNSVEYICSVENKIAAVQYCTNNALQKIEIPERINFLGEDYVVVEIANSVFSNFSELTTVVLPSKIERIKSDAFKGCQKLSNVILNSPECEIMEGAFEKIGLNKVGQYVYFWAPSEVKPNGLNAQLRNWDNSRYIYNNSSFKEGTVFEDDGFNYKIVNTATKSIALMGLVDKNEMRDVIIPQNVIFAATEFTVTSVSENAFENTNIKSVYLPETIEKIGEKSFANCKNLSYVTLLSPNELLKIDDGAFFGLGQKNQGVFFDGYSENKFIDLSVNKKNWDDKNYFYKYAEPQAGEVFEHGQFSYEITSFEEEKKELEILGFASGYSTNVLNTPEILQYKLHEFKVTSIREKAFAENDVLTKVELAKNISSIGSGAFSGCVRLNKVVINYPYTGLIIHPNAFFNIGGEGKVGFYGMMKNRYQDLSSQMGNWDDLRYFYEVTTAVMSVNNYDANSIISVEYPIYYKISQINAEALKENEIKNMMDTSMVVSKHNSYQNIKAKDKYTWVNGYAINPLDFEANPLDIAEEYVRVSFKFEGRELYDAAVVYSYMDEQQNWQNKVMLDENPSVDTVSITLKLIPGARFLVLSENTHSIRPVDDKNSVDINGEVFEPVVENKWGVAVYLLVIFAVITFACQRLYVHSKKSNK